jgi:hypothetical protein
LAAPARDIGITDATTPIFDYWGDRRDDGALDAGADEFVP